MDCLRCVDLEQAFEFRPSKYTEARSAAFYQVSTELAAKNKVDMERAKNDLEEHQLICVRLSSNSSPAQVIVVTENRGFKKVQIASKG